MKALLLAAGRGTRISKYISDNPKCTVDIGDEKLIQYTIKMLNRHGIDEIAMVLGYRGETIKEVLKDYNVKYYYNPFFDVTNSIASAWIARDFIKDDDIIIMNADVFMEEELFESILDSKKSPVMFADSSKKETADYKFKYENGILKKYGKELEGDDISGEYVGIGKFKKEFLPQFNDKLEAMIKQQQHGVWWENVIYDFSNTQDINVEEVNGKFWAEVDYIEDYNKILKFRGVEKKFEI